jgi:hypothetical protein
MNEDIVRHVQKRLLAILDHGTSEGAATAGAALLAFEAAKEQADALRAVANSGVLSNDR